MGAPLWGTSLESRLLRAQLVDWWNEPRRFSPAEQSNIHESVAKEHRIPFLRWWAEHYQSNNPLICAKHPLLCLSAFDLVEAWGNDIRIIRVARPLEQSIAGLTKRQWFRDPTSVQTTLYDAAERFCSSHAHHLVDYNCLVHHPEEQIVRLLDYLELSRSQTEIDIAANLVRREPQS